MPAKQRGTKKAKRPGMKRARAILPLTTTVGRPALREFQAYHATGSLTEAGAGVGAYRTWRLNSIYDPDQTGVGTTTVGYSTRAAYFARYRVLRARFCVSFIGSTGGTSIVGCIVGPNSTFSAAQLNWAIEPGAMSKVIQGNTGTPHSIVRFDQTVDLAKRFGVKKTEFVVNVPYSAAFGSNPDLQMYLHTWIFGQSGAAQTVNYDIKIAYDVSFEFPLQSIPV